mgnify:CR=1 FL=1
MIIIGNHRYGSQGINIGRPSILGNPFIIGRDGTRPEVKAKYKVWFYKQLGCNRALIEEIERLQYMYKVDKTLTLVCWCKPLECHGDIIKEYLEMIT